MRLLSIDWDFFFPILSPLEDKDFLYDWGHAETGHLMTEGIWPIRAAQFMENNLPLPGTSGEEEAFWNRFHFSKAAVLYYADSHSRIFLQEVMENVTEVTNFDAHHDAYEGMDAVFEKKSVDCSTWATGYRLCRVDVRTIYPQWDAWMMEDTPKADVNPEVDNKHRHKHTYDRAFVCRSAAWTPPWIEDKFWRFLLNCPVKNRKRLDDITRRDFDFKEAEEMAKVLRKAKEERANDIANRRKDSEDV